MGNCSPDDEQDVEPCSQILRKSVSSLFLLWASGPGCALAPISLHAPEAGSRIEIFKPDGETVNAELIELGVSPMVLPGELAAQFATAAGDRNRYLEFRITPPAPPGASPFTTPKAFTYRMDPTRFLTTHSLNFSVPRDAPRLRAVTELIYQAESALARRQIGKAERKSHALIQLEPGMPQGYALLGDSAFLRKDFGAATRWYEEALAQDPRYARALKMLASSRQILRARGIDPPGVWISGEPFPEALRAWRELARQQRSLSSEARDGTSPGGPVRLGTVPSGGDASRGGSTRGGTRIGSVGAGAPSDGAGGVFRLGGGGGPADGEEEHKTIEPLIMRDQNGDDTEEDTSSIGP